MSDSRKNLDFLATFCRILSWNDDCKGNHGLLEYRLLADSRRACLRLGEPTELFPIADWPFAQSGWYWIQKEASPVNRNDSDGNFLKGRNVQAILDRDSLCNGKKIVVFDNRTRLYLITERTGAYFG